MKRKIQMTALLCLCLPLMFATFGWTRSVGKPLTQNGLWRLNDLALSGPGSFVVIGPDPYLISPDLDVPFRDVAGIYWDIRLDGGGRAPSLQMFWTTTTHEFGEGFSFRFTPSSTSGFFIPLAGYDPEDVFIRDAVLKNIRLDIEGCDHNCLLTIRQAEWIGQLTAELTARVPEDLVYPETPLPFAEDISDKGPWFLNNIEAEGNGRYRIAGSDPFLVSPPLNVPLSMVQGIHFRLKFPGQSGMRTLQLYWNSFSLDYDQKRSIWFLVEMNHEILDFYLPFKGMPTNDLLKTVRLDFYDAPDSFFEILETRVVDVTDADLHQRTPRQIMYSSGRYASGVRANVVEIAEDIFRRLSEDMDFIIAYAIILLLVIISIGWIGKMRISGRRKKTPRPGEPAKEG